MGVPVVAIHLDIDFAANNRMEYVRPRREQGPVTHDWCVRRALLECALSQGDPTQKRAARQTWLKVQGWDLSQVSKTSCCAQGLSFLTDPNRILWGCEHDVNYSVYGSHMTWVLFQTGTH